MRVRIKKLDEAAVIPKYARSGDAAVDLVAVKKWEDDYGNLCYGTGLAMEIPENHVGLLFPRSSVSKTSLRLCNSVGVIDSGYRGNLKGFFDNMYKSEDWVAEKHTRLVQICSPTLSPIIVEIVDTLDDTERGEGGFGSTGR